MMLHSDLSATITTTRKFQCEYPPKRAKCGLIPSFLDLDAIFKVLPSSLLCLQRARRAKRAGDNLLLFPLFRVRSFRVKVDGLATSRGRRRLQRFLNLLPHSRRFHEGAVYVRFDVFVVCFGEGTRTRRVSVRLSLCPQVRQDVFFLDASRDDHSMVSRRPQGEVHGKDWFRGRGLTLCRDRLCDLHCTLRKAECVV